jgi:hypothetical protein
MGKLSVIVTDRKTSKPVANALATPTSRKAGELGSEGQLFFSQITGADGCAVFADWPGPRPLPASAIQVDVVHPQYYPGTSFNGERPVYDGTHDVTLEVALDPFV